ncbi:aarF domain-containing protein kinase 1-like isoform X1 [Juglans regia]|uniref:AarF domain-containing protein kinase 1-like isoform X1 n=1 Tax=Juglans regia TaxID=51240 RepID=A0A6P9ETV4_JUGRE|nr:aarF domain-containing protein kinase 1-like isoform X1 [Juglans regia]
MRTGIFKFPAKAKTRLYLVACAGAATATGVSFHAFNPNSPSLSYDSFLRSSIFPEKILTVSHGVIRSSRAIYTIACTVVDYKYSLYGLPIDSYEYLQKLSEVHSRSAKRIQNLCEANKGFYVKAGQFVVSLRQVPKEYSSTLSSLQDQTAPCDFKAIKKVLISNLGQDLSEIFLSLDEQPIAAASIAQVHRGTLKDQQEVAIKVQYPGLENQMKLDTSIMSFLSKCIEWFFPEYRFEWLVSEFVETISLELDFIQEAKNSERTAKNFKSNDMVWVPYIFWELTTRQVLTMEFCRGCKVDDVEFLKEMGINPIKVARALVEVYAEMIFIHGFVHGDPHPGNILVSPEGRYGFSLVLLDHGIYKQLDEGFRLDYCELWKALILLDSKKIQQLGECFGVGKYARYFPLIFTGRTIDSKSPLGRGMSSDEKRNLKQELRSLQMEDISSFMESLPPEFLIILRTDGLLRSILRKLGASQRVRLLAYAKCALYGLSLRSNPQSDFPVKAALSRLKTNISYLHLRLVLEVLDLLSWMKKIRRLLYTLTERMSVIFAATSSSILKGA